MWFFKNGSGWLYRYDKSDKPQASRRSQAPIFRQQATRPQATVSYLKIPGRPQAPSSKRQLSGRKPQAARLQNLETNGKSPERGGFAYKPK